MEWKAKGSNVEEEGEQSKFERQFCGIQYLGLAGITSACLDGILRLIHYGDIINKAWLLSSIDDEGNGTHAFILDVNNDETIAIKSGFSSGYGGTGPTGLSIALGLLERHAGKIEEYDVSEDFLARLDRSCLLRTDLENIEVARYIMPYRYYDYMREKHDPISSNGYEPERLNFEFPTAIPYRLLDSRLTDLALDFFKEPDAKLLMAFRRLEDLIRKRTAIKGKSGAKLFSETFQGEDSILFWGDEEKSEHAAKANMFTSIFGAYRNPRAHKESDSRPEDCLNELLLLNELYKLEAKAIERPLKEKAIV